MEDSLLTCLELLVCTAMAYGWTRNIYAAAFVLNAGLFVMLVCK